METAIKHNMMHKDLLDACKRGDSGAQMKIYRLYYKPMYHVSLRIIGDTMEAEDVMQEAFLVAFKNIRSVDLNISFGGWLKRIVVNRSLDAVRKRKPQVELVTDYSDEIPSESYYQPEEGTIQEKVEKVRRALEKLPEKYRVVLSLSLFEGYDHDEIGQILGVTPSTSRAQLSRGKQKLLQLMTG
ncbi:MAG: sigma-70 family RNA polymerase sigma factor [Bacteroidia bacterium]|nr:sigma-70 family RNA polymerase sigma factor [Bacteroidia bacterium]